MAHAHAWISRQELGTFRQQARRIPLLSILLFFWRQVLFTKLNGQLCSCTDSSRHSVNSFIVQYEIVVSKCRLYSVWLKIWPHSDFGNRRHLFATQGAVKATQSTAFEYGLSVSIIVQGIQS